MGVRERVAHSTATISRMTTLRTLTRSAVSPAVLILLGACSSARNDRVAVGEETLPAFAATHEARTDDAPSAGIMSRSGWGEVVFDVPVDGTIHQPTYRLGSCLPDRSPTARQRGAYPTHDSALDTEGDAGARVLEMFAAPLGAALEIVLFPIHAVMQPMWSETASPAQEYERSRSHENTARGAGAHCPLCPKPERGS